MAAAAIEMLSQVEHEGSQPLCLPPLIYPDFMLPGKALQTCPETHLFDDSKYLQVGN